MKKTAKVKLLFRGAVWMISLAGIIGTVVFLLSRLPENTISTKKQDDPVLAPNGTPRALGKVTLPNVPSSESLEWCSPSRIIATKADPVFKLFGQWVAARKEGRAEVEKGVVLAKERREVLVHLIRTDPEAALSLAVPEIDRHDLPKAILPFLGRWVNTYADVEAVHFCLDPNHLGGFIRHTVILPDGRRLKASLYGKREKLPTMKGLAIRGIAVGDKLAVDENPVRRLGETELRDRQLEGLAAVEIADAIYEFPRREGVLAFERRVREAERRAGRHRVRYPVIASSLGSSTIIDLKYKVVTVSSDWETAKEDAENSGGRLVCIGSAQENEDVRKLLADANVMGLFPEYNGTVPYAWIGGTDDEDTKGSSFNKVTDSTEYFDLNATEGNWTWLDGTTFAAYSNWADGENDPVLAEAEDFAVMDWNAGGLWRDLKPDFHLPYVIEMDLGDQPDASDVPISDNRKVLVIRARFQDEGVEYAGSSKPVVDQDGNIINPDKQQDVFEPVTGLQVRQEMEKVREFYQRNSDGKLNLDYVITGTVTIPYKRWEQHEMFGDILTVTTPDFMDAAIVIGAPMARAAQVSPEDWDFSGPAFNGVIGIEVNASGGGYLYPPLVRIEGGGGAGAKAETFLDNNGSIASVLVTDTGRDYTSVPAITVEGAHQDPNGDANATLSAKVGRTAVSWISITTGGNPGGVGMVGAPGSHVNAATWDAGVAVHELGHNFGFQHANRYESVGEKAISDEGGTIDYGNPYSVMGTGGIGADLTVAAKSVAQFGYTTSSATGADVTVLATGADIVASRWRELNATRQNVFRVYRHDHGSAPYPLRLGSYHVIIPTDVDLPTDFNGSITVAIGGPGTEATASASVTGSDRSYILEIENPGIGFSEEPRIELINEQNATLLLDPAWIQVLAGQKSIKAELRDRSPSSAKGLRAIRLSASSKAPYSSYLVSYRQAATKNGLNLLNADGSDNILLDLTRNTPDDFNDGSLMIGQTYSDYDSDIHVTPVSRGGNSPMEYLEVAVNVGTVAAENASAPLFSLQTSNLRPEVNQGVEFTVMLTGDANLSRYAFSWYYDERPLIGNAYLNQPTIIKTFDSVGNHNLRAVVSDMKGGVSSQTVVLAVGEPEQAGISRIEGVVESTTGPVQGARVVLQKAPVIQHVVTVSGDLISSRIPGGQAYATKFLIDGQRAPRLEFRRGEIHRFEYEPSAEGYPITFYSAPDSEPAKVELKLIYSPRVEEPGSGYRQNPAVVLDGGIFDSYESNLIRSYVEYLEENGSSTTLARIVYKPYAKSLLMDTGVEAIHTRKVADTQGGDGHHPASPPSVTISRQSLWEDYSDLNATAKAYVDGVGTIFVLEAGAGYPDSPSIAVVGRGVEASASTQTMGVTNEKGQTQQDMIKKVSVVDQGQGYDLNTTLATALYPPNPFAYWSFDREESLFRQNYYPRKDKLMLEPSPGWLRPITRSLKAHWSMDEENSTMELNATIADHHIGATPVLGQKTDYNATMELNATIADRSEWGIRGRAIRLQGNSTVEEYLAPDSPNKFLGDSFTVSLWVKPDGIVSFHGHGLASQAGTGGNEDAFSLYWNTGDFIGILYKAEENGGLGSDVVLEGGDLNAGEWTHVAYAFDEDSATASMYVMGELVATKTFTLADNYKISNRNSSFILGKAFARPVDGGGGEYLNGFLDEVSVFDRALEPREIRQLSGDLFLDLSGQNRHGVAMDMPMNDPDELNAGVVAGNQNDGLDLSGARYVDLSQTAQDFAALSTGSVSFWFKTTSLEDGTPADGTILAASDKDDPDSFFRLMVRDTGQLQFHVSNDGVEVTRFYTENIFNDFKWHHGVLVVNEADSLFYVDGIAVGLRIAGQGQSAPRGFFADIENIDYMGIGRHQTSEANQTNYFSGELDEVWIFDRVLEAPEISFLHDLRPEVKDVFRASLEARVDSVGTVKVTAPGAGYKETPAVTFSPGDTVGYTWIGSAEDGNVSRWLPLNLAPGSSQPDEWDASATYVKGDLVRYRKNAIANWYTYSAFRENNDKKPLEANLMENNSRHIYPDAVWQRHERSEGSMTYGVLYLQPIGLESILLTKDMGPAAVSNNFNQVLLPDGNPVERRYVEYVGENGTAYELSGGHVWAHSFSTSQDYSLPKPGPASGVFGFRAPPSIVIEGSETDDNATGSHLFYIDPVESVLITDPGNGYLDPEGFAVGDVRFRGKGSTPPRFEAIMREQAIHGFILRRPGTGPYDFDVERNSTLDGIFDTLTERGLGGLSDGERYLSMLAGTPEITTKDNGDIVYYPASEGFWGTRDVFYDAKDGQLKLRNPERLLSFIGDGTGEKPPVVEVFLSDKLDVERGVAPRKYEVKAMRIMPAEDLGSAKPDYGSGWVKPPTIYFDLNATADRQVNASSLTFTNMLSHVQILDSGLGYSVPVEVNFHGGYDIPWNYKDLKHARVSILPDEVDENGTLSADAIELLDPGTGYSRPPFVSITGGGGVGARARAFLNGSGEVAAILVTNGGRGYFNLDANNTPKAVLVNSNPAGLELNFKEANVTMRLGGSLDEIPVQGLESTRLHHIAPWVLITDNAGTGKGATAFAKVVNGRIEKVIVENAGNSYLDPRIEILTASPNNADALFLSNPNYRDEIDGWIPFNARCSAIFSNGQIVEIIVDNPGSGYASPEIVVAGTGSGVEAIPVFGDTGKIVRIVYDDPALKNEELSPVSSPSGAGQGFSERPWALDEVVRVTVVDEYSYSQANHFHEAAFPLKTADLFIGLPATRDSAGDQVSEFTIHDHGIGYGADAPSIRIDFNSSHAKSFRDACATAFLTRGLSEMVLEGNGTYEDSNGKWRSVFEEIPVVEIHRANLEEEDAYKLTSVGRNGDIDYDPLAHRRFIDVVVDDAFPSYSSYSLSDWDREGLGGEIHTLDSAPSLDWRVVTKWEPGKYRKGDVVWWETDAYEALATFVSGSLDKESAGEDGDQFWRKLNGQSGAMSALGVVTAFNHEFGSSSISVSRVRRENGSAAFFHIGDRSQETEILGENVYTWAYLPDAWISYTDSNGYYSFPNLEPGLYNAAVLAEDSNLEEITFREDGNSTVTHVVYVPGIPSLRLETDENGVGSSSLIWPEDVLRLGESASTKKILKGIGAGFRPGTLPVFSITADSKNTGRGIPNLSVTVNPDGSLDIETVDENSSNHNSADSFTVFYGSTISGLNFKEDYFFDRLDDAYWMGRKAAVDANASRLIISPSAGVNSVEMPISSSEAGDLNMTFSAKGYDRNGTLLDTDDIQWKLEFDFNSTEGNLTKLASLSTVEGNSTTLILRSTLRSGKVASVRVDAGGTGYSDDNSTLVEIFGDGSGALARISEVNSTGSVKAIEVVDGGSGYSVISGIRLTRPEGQTGTDANLTALVGGGLWLKATLGSHSLEQKVRLEASHRAQLSEKEQWSDLHFDTVREDFIDWNDDNDSDGLNNSLEFSYRTNPWNADSDGDGLSDGNETTLMTDPNNADTDSDGLLDGVETNTNTYVDVNNTGTNPKNPDTDGDGWPDGLEVSFGLDPHKTEKGGAGISGMIYFKGEMNGTLYVFAIPEGAPPFAEETAVSEFLGGDKPLTPSSATFYFFKNLPAGKKYEIHAFIDRGESGDPSNKVYDYGEPVGSYSGSWDGNLSEDRSQVNFVVKDPPPHLTLLRMVGSVMGVDEKEIAVYLNPGVKVSHVKPVANDGYDGIIDPKTVSPSSTYPLDGNATGIITITELSATEGSGTLEVSSTALPGVYHLIYAAADSAGSIGSVTRIIVIRDSIPPEISLFPDESVVVAYEYEAGTKWEDPGYSAIDVVDGNLTHKVGVELPLGWDSGDVGIVLGFYNLNYTVQDIAGNQALATRIVKIVDTSAPDLLLFGSPSMNLNKGETFLEPGYSALDTVDGDLSNRVTVSGSETLDENVTGTYELNYSVIDDSGNEINSTRTIYVADWNYTIAGKAMDGYLVGASVVFDIDGNGTHDLSSPVLTDESGAFSFAFTTEEFLMTDTNTNGAIDPGEGRILVFGGTDSSTLEPFTGLYVADANSTVVNPLTTLSSAFVEQGLSREDAKLKVADALGLSATLDLYNYDPIAAAAEGDANASQALAASARIANAIRQGTAFVKYASDGNASGKTISTQLITEVAAKIADGTVSLFGDASEMQKVLTSVVTTLGIAGVTDEDLAGAAQMSVVADGMIVESLIAKGTNPDKLAVELAKIQAVVEDSIVQGYDKLRLEGGTPATLAIAKSKELLSGQTSDYNGSVNIFPPTASNAVAALPFDQWIQGAIILNLHANDADGDTVGFSISSGNPDADKDGVAAFSLSEQGQLLVADADEAGYLSVGEAMVVALRLTDGKGLYGTATVTVKRGNALALNTAEVEQAQNWHQSSWLGDFFTNGSSWVFHESLGWLYVVSDRTGGFWFWDVGLEAWWWTNSTFFPHFYLVRQTGSGWGYWDLKAVPPIYFDFNENSWKEKTK